MNCKNVSGGHKSREVGRSPGQDSRTWDFPMQRTSHNHYIVTFSKVMAQAVSRRLLTVEARVHARVSPRGICGG
jgi:hypothetical protein